MRTQGVGQETVKFYGRPLWMAPKIFDRSALTVEISMYQLPNDIDTRYVIITILKSPTLSISRVMSP